MSIFNLVKASAEQAQLLGRAALGLTQSGLLAPLTPYQTWLIARQAVQMGRSIATLAMVAAVRFPETPAVIDERGSITYRDLDVRVARIAAAMATKYQIGVGDTVALMCRNHRGFVEAFLAAMRLGAHVVLLNTDFPGPQLEQVLARHTLKLLIHDQEFDAVVARANYHGAVVLAWVDLPSADQRGVAQASAAQVNANQVRLDELALHPARSLPRVKKAGDIILLTSGTTGVPKGAPRSPAPTAYIGSAVTVMAKIPFQSQQPIFIGPPLFHGFGLAFMATCLATGAPMAIQRRFRPPEVLQFMRQHRVKVLVAVPAMLQRLLDVPFAQQVDLSGLSAVLAAAAPLSGALATRWMDQHGDHLYNLYGSTETGFCAMATPADLRAASGTVGLPPLGTQLRIMDAAGETLSAGEIGHICIKSPMLFEGYVGGGHKTSMRGFMNTGDVGHVDMAGRLFVDGREDDMIVSGGENVYPQEIEELLATYTGIAEVAVVGVEDAEFGQRLKAFVVWRAGHGADAVAAEAALRDFIRAHVARYKMPREFVFLDELPRNITGKVLKKVLQAQSTAPATVIPFPASLKEA